MPFKTTDSARLWRQNKALFTHKKCLDKHQLQADYLTSSKRWWLIDATKVPTGRLANEVAKILLGKHKPTFHPNADCGDHVVIINAKHTSLTGHKWDKKLFYSHSGYPGSLKIKTAQDKHERTPTEMIRLAIHGMMPSNWLRIPRMRKLHIYEDAEHPYEQNINSVLSLTKKGEISPLILKEMKKNIKWDDIPDDGVLVK